MSLKKITDDPKNLYCYNYSTNLDLWIIYLDKPQIEPKPHDTFLMTLWFPWYLILSNP